MNLTNIFRSGFFASTLLLLVVLTGCGVDLIEDESEQYSYELSQNGCSTGFHAFNSKQALCDALKRQDLNQFCAESLREDMYHNQSCSGPFELN